jgi:hypothetical protein
MSRSRIHSPCDLSEGGGDPRTESESNSFANLMGDLHSASPLMGVQNGGTGEHISSRHAPDRWRCCAIAGMI